MSYRIAQSEEYLGRDYWNWSAWIEATPDELDQLEVVIWILHPSFSPSRVESRSRDTQFRLSTSGWGTFRLRAELHCKGRDPLSISRNLRLTYPDNQEPNESASTRLSSAPRKRSEGNNSPTVFLSYSSEDESQALQVRQAMERLGARVLDARSISADVPFDAAIRKMIRESDAVMSVIGSDYASPYVLTEMKVAAAEEKPTITLLPENVGWPSGLSRGAQVLRIGKDSIPMESRLAGFIGNLGSQERN